MYYLSVTPTHVFVLCASMCTFIYTHVLVEISMSHFFHVITLKAVTYCYKIMQLIAVCAYAKTASQVTRKGCHLHVALAIKYASSGQDVSTLGSLECRHAGLGVAGPTHRREVRRHHAAAVFA